MSKKHFKLSASGSATWINCAGSVEAQKNYPKKSSKFADEGTLAHELADLCLKNNQDAEEWIDREISCESDGKILKCYVDKEMAKYVQEYLDYVRSHENINTKLFTEDQVDFSNITEGGFGTMDSAVLDFKTGHCDIFDLKYGRGVEVDAYKNSQGMIYASGFYNEMKFLGVITSFTIHIVQPRRKSISEYSFTIEELENFIEFAKFRALETKKPNAKRTPGDKQCQWCLAFNDCPAVWEQTLETIGDDFDNLNEENMPSTLTQEQIKKILDNKSLIEKFLKKIQENVFEKMLSGEKFPGYKLVRGKSNRKWSDEAEAKLKELLGPKAYEEPSLIGITAAEKLLKKPIVNKLTIKPEGKIQIASENDEREEVKPVTDDFDNLEIENDDL